MAALDAGVVQLLGGSVVGGGRSWQGSRRLPTRLCTECPKGPRDPLHSADAAKINNKNRRPIEEVIRG